MADMRVDLRAKLIIIFTAEKQRLISLSLSPPPPAFSPSLISLMVSVTTFEQACSGVEPTFSFPTLE